MQSSRALSEPLTPTPALLVPGAETGATRLVSAGFAVAFVAVCVAGLAQALAAAPQAFPQRRLGLLTLLAVAYALLGTLGLGLLERRGTGALGLRLSLLPLALLGGAATLLSHGYASMLLLALVSTSVLLLSFRASVLVSLGAGLLALCAFASRGSVWSALLQAEMAFGSGVAFVFVFSRIALRERAARGELTRMATALGQANAELAAHAGRVEELATSAERNRIAREIHDGLGHYLTVIHVQLEAG
ncbi:MAG TPA: histidine kinase, partial [Polyangiales bacterium]